MGIKKCKYFLKICILFLVISCAKENRWDCLKRTGGVVSETRETDNFTELEINGNFMTILIPDSVNEVRIEAGKNLISLVKTDIKDGKLVLGNDNRCNWTRSYSKDIKVFVHFKELNQIFINETCDISNTNTINSNDFSISISKNVVSDINLTFRTRNFKFVQNSGSGTYTFNGAAGNAYYYQKGAGQINSGGLETGFTHVVNKSSGDIHVWVNQKLSVEYTGTGNIYYKGNPAEIYYSETMNPGKLYKE